MHSMISEYDKSFEKNKSSWDKRNGGVVSDRGVDKGLLRRWYLSWMTRKSWPCEYRSPGWGYSKCKGPEVGTSSMQLEIETAVRVGGQWLGRRQEFRACRASQIRMRREDFCRVKLKSFIWGCRTCWCQFPCRCTILLCSGSLGLLCVSLSPCSLSKAGYASLRKKSSLHQPLWVISVSIGNISPFSSPWSWGHRERLNLGVPRLGWGNTRKACAQRMRWEQGCFNISPSNRMNSSTEVYSPALGNLALHVGFSGSASGKKKKKKKTDLPMQEMWVQSLCWEDPLEESMATHSISLPGESLMDRGAWWATVTGVEKNRTWLKWLRRHAHGVDSPGKLLNWVQVPNTDTLLLYPHQNLLEIGK